MLFRTKWLIRKHIINVLSQKVKKKNYKSIVKWNSKVKSLQTKKMIMGAGHFQFDYLKVKDSGSLDLNSKKIMGDMKR